MSNKGLTMVGERDKLDQKDKNNIVTIEASEEEAEASHGGREERERKGRNGRRMRVKPRRSRYLENEGAPAPASPRNVPMKNAVMMLNEMFPPPGRGSW